MSQNSPKTVSIIDCLNSGKGQYWFEKSYSYKELLKMKTSSKISTYSFDLIGFRYFETVFSP